MKLFDKVEVIYNIDNDINSLLKEIELNLDRLKLINKQKRDYLITKSILRSVHSSLSIEANSLSLLEVLKISQEKPVIGKQKEIQEVKNTIEIYNDIKNYNYKSEEDFIKAYKVMMKSIIEDLGYRDHGEAVKKDDKIIYIAPNHIFIPNLMKSLFEYLNKEDINLLTGAIFHYYLVAIHPFSDGNGRMARFWMNLILTSYNKDFEFVPVEEEIYLNQEYYYKAIEESHINGNVNVFIKFILQMINDSLLKTIINNSFVPNDIQNKIIDLITNNSKITQREIAYITNVSERTIKRNFKILIDNKIIKRIGSDKTGSWEVLF